MQPADRGLEFPWAAVCERVSRSGSRVVLTAVSKTTVPLV